MNNYLSIEPIKPEIQEKINFQKNLLATASKKNKIYFLASFQSKHPELRTLIYIEGTSWAFQWNIQEEPVSSTWLVVTLILAAVEEAADGGILFNAEVALAPGSESFV